MAEAIVPENERYAKCERLTGICDAKNLVMGMYITNSWHIRTHGIFVIQM